MSDQVTADKTKALDQALGQIEKHYGKGAIMRLGADEKIDVTVIPTGCLSLDLALGVGGIPRGRVVEIYGPEASGKNHPGLAGHRPRPNCWAGWRPLLTPSTP